MDAITTRAAQLVPTPDTGNLHDDLHAFAAATNMLADTEQGRRWFHRMLPTGRYADLYEISSDFWDLRFNAVAPILHRAAQRGELRDNIDPGDALRMLSVALYFDVIFSDAPVRPDYASQVLDIFIRGIIR